MEQYLPILFLLACPLMMIFMMKGMHGSEGTSHHEAAGPTASAPGGDANTAGRVAELEREVQDLRTQLAAKPDRQIDHL